MLSGRLLFNNMARRTVSVPPEVARFVSAEVARTGSALRVAKMAGLTGHAIASLACGARVLPSTLERVRAWLARSLDEAAP